VRAIVAGLVAFAVLTPTRAAECSFGEVAGLPGFAIFNRIRDPLGSGGTKVTVAMLEETDMEADVTAWGLAETGAEESGAAPMSSRRLFRPIYQDMFGSRMETP